MRSTCSVGKVLMASSAGLAVGALTVLGNVPTFAALLTALLLFAIGLGIVAYRAQLHQAELEAVRTKAEDLQSSYVQLVENLPVGLFIRKNGRFVSTNWAWDEQMMREPFTTPEAAFERSVPREELPDIRWQIEEAERTEMSLTLEYMVSHEGLSNRYLQWRSVPIYGQDSELSHFIGFNIDITDVKLANIALQEKNQALSETYEELEANLEAMVRSLVKTIEAKDTYTAGHTERVTQYALRLADEIGVSEQDRMTLRMGTLLHDIGKVGIPDHILTKPAGLTDEEFAIIKLHPEIGASVLEGIPRFKQCLPIVRWHHEKLNGRGYPDGLTEEQIPLLVRIATIADMYDAMTSTRAYRKAMTPALALSELKKDVLRGALDPDLVETWEQILRRQGLLNEGSLEKAA